MKRLYRFPTLFAVCFVLLWGGTGETQQRPATPPPAAEELIVRERTRSAIEKAFELVGRPEESGEEAIENYNAAVQMVVDAGPDAIPLLIDELDQDLERTFFFTAYALGHFGHDARIDDALRRAVARAEEQPGEFPLVRKAWACYGLALLGQVDALDLFGSGNHVAGYYFVHGGTSMLEASALLIGPASVPVLLAQLDRYRDDESRQVERGFTIRALRRVADPASVPKLLKVLEEPAPLMRREAARALGTIGTPEAIAGLAAALEDEEMRVRRAAVQGLDLNQAADRLPLFIERLDKEDDPILRGKLYRLVARFAGPSAYEILRPYWGRPDPRERAAHVAALVPLRRNESVDLYRRALGDPEGQVVIQAVNGLLALDTPEATDLFLEGIDSASWFRAQLTVEKIAARQITSAAGAVAGRLLETELSGVVTDGEARTRVQKLCETLVALGSHSRIDELRAAAKRQKDASLIDYLAGVIRRLEQLKKNGKNVRRWTETAKSDDRELRSLAYEQLGRLGGRKAAEALVERFGRVEPGEGREILRALGEIDSEPSRALILRVLTAPEFDGFEWLGLRDVAAWGARRLGGEEMLEALRVVIERRDGREVAPMVYLALLGGKKALPTLARYRVPRLRYLKWSRGAEQEKLDWIVGEIEAGRPIDAVDLPPENLQFR